MSGPDQWVCEKHGTHGFCASEWDEGDSCKECAREVREAMDRVSQSLAAANRRVEECEATLRTYCQCAIAGYKPLEGYDCGRFPCRAGVTLAGNAEGETK